MPARSRTKISVASPTIAACSNSSSSCAKRSPRCSMIVTSWFMRRRVAREVRADLAPPATRMNISAGHLQEAATRAGLITQDLTASESTSIAVDVGETFEAEGRVELGARRVEDANDRALDAEALLRDLADHEVRVVAVGRDDDRVGILDSRFVEDVDVQPWPTTNRRPMVTETSERLLVLVERDDVPAGWVSSFAIADPTRPHPMTIAFIA